MSGKRNPLKPRSEIERTVGDWIDDFKTSLKWMGLASRTQKDYDRGLKSIRDHYGNWPAVKLVNDPDLPGMLRRWMVTKEWNGKEADYRLDAFKALAKYLVKEKPSLFPKSQLAGMGKIYQNPGRAEIIWGDADIKKFIETARPELVRAFVFLLETGARLGDAIHIGPANLRLRKDGRKALIWRPNKGRRKGRVANVLVSPMLEELIASTPEGQSTYLINSHGTSWKSTTLGRAITDHARSDDVGIRRELRQTISAALGPRN